MGTGSFTFEGEDEASVPLGRTAALVAVFRYGGGTEDSEYELLPNVRCLSIEMPGDGMTPGAARFRYAFGDPLGDPKDPSRVEKIYPLDATGKDIVMADDRLVVYAMADDGTVELLFDGFASIPQADLSGEDEAITFEALGTPIREWDRPLEGAITRDADKPTDPEADRPTWLPARFNPYGYPNATPEAADSGEGSRTYPVFLGPIWPPNDKDDDGNPISKINGSVIRPWSIAMACCYCMARGNRFQQYVKTSDHTGLTAGLVSIEPKDGGPIDMKDTETYTTKPIEVEDYDVRGEAWPTAIARLVSPYGFGSQFVLEMTEEKNPTWRVDLYRKDDVNRIKSLYLQSPDDVVLDPGRTNVAQLKLARDANETVNHWIVDTVPDLWEVSFILAPGFEIDAADANPDSLNKFKLARMDTKYRVWVFDECGEGHWDFGHILAGTWVTGHPPDLRFVLNAEIRDPRPYANRRRPGRATLLSRDEFGTPRQSILHVSNDYAGDAPGLWDGKTGTWQQIHTNGWQLLKDRLGFRVTADDPNDWHTAEPIPDGEDPDNDKSVAYATAGVLRLVDWCAKPEPPDFPSPTFRLTCVIEGDTGIDASAGRRDSSVTTFDVRRRHNAGNRYRRCRISRYSMYAAKENLGAFGDDTDAVNETEDAKAWAAAMRRETEGASFAGTVRLAGIRTSYKVGDQIDKIVGRDISLRQNLGSGDEETPVYPSIVAVRYDLDGGQYTTLQLSDRRGEPPRRRRKAEDDPTD